MLDPHDALIVVDPQVDFFPGGALGVPDGDAIRPALNAAISSFEESGLPVFVSRDWHPEDHCSFVSSGGRWPPHCVRGTRGADLDPELELPAVFTMVHKATSSGRDAYSAFDLTGLGEELKRRGIRRVFVGGLALDYCVKATCLDAVDSGFDVVLLTDATRAVNVDPDDGARALSELASAGVTPLDGACRLGGSSPVIG
jgi:nicotinamidase/pyrazinamidase